MADIEIIDQSRMYGANYYLFVVFGYYYCLEQNDHLLKTR